ncbi:hypothetical protein HAX54_046143, partial [Datura stramonium]|nr:hypothetical protein [Datura stramonium]
RRTKAVKSTGADRAAAAAAASREQQIEPEKKSAVATSKTDLAAAEQGSSDWRAGRCRWRLEQRGAEALRSQSPISPNSRSRARSV